MEIREDCISWKRYVLQASDGRFGRVRKPSCVLVMVLRSGRWTEIGVSEAVMLVHGALRRRMKWLEAPVSRTVEVVVLGGEETAVPGE